MDPLATASGWTGGTGEQAAQVREIAVVPELPQASCLSIHGLTAAVIRVMEVERGIPVPVPKVWLADGISTISIPGGSSAASHLGSSAAAAGDHRHPGRAAAGHTAVHAR
jgi:hypothetical protein